MNKINPKPPGIAKRFLTLLSEYQNNHSIAGDIEEVFKDIILEKGRIYAYVWFWFHTLSSVAQYSSLSLFRSFVMYKNYFMTAFRNLKKYKGFSIINISGLAIGMACCILISFFVFDEISFDKFNKKADRMYRVCSSYSNGRVNVAFSAPPMAAAFLEDFPEVEEAVRLSLWKNNRLVEYGNKRFIEAGIIYADSTIFNLFDFPFINGDPNTALTKPYTLVITKIIAEKYFGDKNPIGELLEINSNKRKYEITGVLENCPSNSHVQFDFIVSLVSDSDSDSDRWMDHTFFSYILLKDKTDPSQLESKFQDFIFRHYGPQFYEDNGIDYEEYVKKNNNYYRYKLQPFLDIHLDTDVVENLSLRSDIRYIYIFSIIAVIILLIACINFMNISTARYASRSKEIGMRKVLGSGKSGLISQFMIESVLISLISLCAGVLIVWLVLPAFNVFTGKELDLLYFGGIGSFVNAVGFGVLTGLFAGIYPAFYLSSFQPIKVLRSSFRNSKSSNLPLRKILVVFQFAVAVIILICSYIVFDQLQFIQSVKLGFESDRIMVIERGNILGDKKDTFMQELIQNSNIIDAANTSTLPGRHFNPNGHKLEGAAKGDDVTLFTIFGDQKFAELYDVEFAEGRNFSREISSDANSVIINEAAVKMLGLTQPIGTRFVKQFDNGIQGDFVSVIGVIKDINYHSLHREIQPMIIRNLGKANASYISVKIKPDNVTEAIKYVREKWSVFSSDQPLVYSFLDDDLAALYDNDRKTGQLFSVFFILSIFVACLGLFGLILFSVEQRTKEIGVRKSLGASKWSIMRLLSGEIATLISIACIIAMPVSYFAMNKWLQDFAYRTEINASVFFEMGILSVLIALFAVSYHVIKAAITNPVDSLRYE